MKKKLNIKFCPCRFTRLTSYFLGQLNFSKENFSRHSVTGDFHLKFG